MARSRRYLPAAWRFLVSAACVAFSSWLAVSVPESGRAINPFITLTVYALPVAAVLVAADGLFRLFLLRRDLPPRSLGDVVVLKALQRWSRQNEAEKPAAEPEEEG